MNYGGNKYNSITNKLIAHNLDYSLIQRRYTLN